jgi:hypothetical protein
MEWYAVKSLMADENVNIEFDLPTIHAGARG